MLYGFLRRSTGATVAAASAAALFLSSPRARAAPPSSDAPSRSELATARELFAQAERDEDAGRWQDALDKMRQVALVKLTAGVRYHIALGEEHLGLLVSALEDFEAAQDQAHLEHAEDVLSLVGGELESLRPRVPRLALHVTPENLSPAVTLDGRAIGPNRIGESISVNPGVHTVEVHAEGRRPAIVSVTLQERDATSLDIPLSEPPSPAALPAIPTALSNRQPAQAPRLAWSQARIGAVAATGGAIALAGFGIAAYVVAGSARERGESTCAGIVSTSPDACDAQKNIVRAWDWTAAASWAGAVVSTGFAIYFFGGPAAGGTTSWRVGPASLVLQGSF
jgi:hypothetical protein